MRRGDPKWSFVEKKLPTIRERRGGAMLEWANLRFAVLCQILAAGSIMERPYSNSSARRWRRTDGVVRGAL
jgi:hypothetical protein